MAAKGSSAVTAVRRGAMMKRILLAPGRREVLFEHQLEHVRQRLQQAPGAHPVGAVAQLDETQDLAFQQDRVGYAGEQYAHHHGDFRPD